MLCPNCQTNNDDNAAFCQNCGAAITSETNASTENNKKVRGLSHREKLNIMGVSIPLVFVSFFIVILGYGGYVTPLLLLAGVLLLCNSFNTTLASNFITVLGIYLAQFTTETLLTFVGSIPTKFLTWLASLYENDLDALAKIADIQNGCSNVFTFLAVLVSLFFLAIYVLCIISLFKSEKIKIPYVRTIVRKFIDD